MNIDNFTFNIKSYLEPNEGKNDSIEIDIIDNEDLKKYKSIIDIHKDLRDIPDFLRDSETIIKMISSSFKKEQNMTYTIVKNDNSVQLEFVFDCYFNTIKFIIDVEQLEENDMDRVDRHFSNITKTVNLLTERIKILENKLQEKEGIKRNTIKESHQELKLILCNGQDGNDMIYILTMLHTYLLQDFINENRDIFKDCFRSYSELSRHYYYPDNINTYKIRNIDKLLVNNYNIDKLYNYGFIPVWVSIVNGLINNYIDISTTDKTNYCTLFSMVECKAKLFYINGKIMGHIPYYSTVTVLEKFIKNNELFLKDWQDRTKLFIKHIKDKKSLNADIYDFIQFINRKIKPDLFKILTNNNSGGENEIHKYL